VSILDSFFILFESDASKLDKGLTDSKKKTDDLQKDLKATDVVAGGLGKSLVGALAGLAAAAAATVGFAALTHAVLEASDAADHLDETAERLDTSVETLSVWGDLTKKAGGSTDAFAGSIEAFNKQLAQVEVTGKSRAAPFLKELGIDLEDAKNKGKSAMDFLPELADSFAGLSAQKAISLGSRLGLDQATIMTLRQGRREVEELLQKEKELGVVTAEQGKIAAEFNDQLDDTRHAFRSILLGVSEYVLPPLTWMAEKFQQVAIWMRKHADFIKGLFIAIGAAIAYFAIPPMISLAIATVAAFAPFIALAAILAAVAVAFALLYDDVMNFIDGNDSLIGQILEKYPMIGEVVKAVGAAFMTTWEVIKSVAGFLVDVWNDPAAAFQAFTEGLMAAMQAAGEFIASIWQGIVDSVMGAINAIASGWEKAKSLVGLGGESGDAGSAVTAQAVAAGQSQLGAAAASPMAGQTSNSINNAKQVSKSTNVQVGKVEVHTQASDAQGISKAIGSNLQSQMTQAASQYDDGVAA